THKTFEPPYTEPYVRWWERSTSQLMASLLLDSSPIGRLRAVNFP
ncbi:hypothetical protein ABH968_005178, partial [Lysinibacillus sp. RC79]